MSGASYTYTRLDALHGVPAWSRVHVYGVVAEAWLPKRTKGTDHASSLKLAGPGGASVFVRLFAADPAKLPSATKVGMVVRLHRVEVVDYNDTRQLQAKVGKHGFAYVTFHSEPAQRCVEASGPTYTFDERADGQRLAEMRALSAELRAKGPERNAYCRRICELGRDGGAGGAEETIAYFDLVCRVLRSGVAHRSDKDGGAPILYVWDGTDAELSTLAASGDVIEGRLLYAAPAVEGTLPPLPSLGTTLPVICASHTREQLPSPGPGWVRLRNLELRIGLVGQVQAQFTGESSWSSVSTDEDALHRYQQRVTHRQTIGAALADGPPEPGSVGPGQLTSVRHPDQPFSTLREVKSRRPPAKFRCLVQVTGYLPAAIDRFTCRRSEVEGSGDGYVYTVTLRLSDATNVVEAYLYDEDAAEFFHGLPPAPLHAGGAQCRALENMVHTLNGSGETHPYIQVCLMTYVADGVDYGALAPSQREGAVRCRVFGTSLVGWCGPPANGIRR